MTKAPITLLAFVTLLAAACSSTTELAQADAEVNSTTELAQVNEVVPEPNVHAFVSTLGSLVSLDYDPLQSGRQAADTADFAAVGEIIDVTIAIESFVDAEAILCDVQERQARQGGGADEPFTCHNPDGNPELDDRYLGITVRPTEVLVNTIDQPSDTFTAYIPAPLVGDVKELLSQAPRGEVLIVATQGQPPRQRRGGSLIWSDAEASSEAFLVPFPDGLWFEVPGNQPVGPWAEAHTIEDQWQIRADSIHDIAAEVRSPRAQSRQ